MTYVILFWNHFFNPKIRTDIKKNTAKENYYIDIYDVENDVKNNDEDNNNDNWDDADGDADTDTDTDTDTGTGTDTDTNTDDLISLWFSDLLWNQPQTKILKRLGKSFFSVYFLIVLWIL